MPSRSFGVLLGRQAENDDDADNLAVQFARPADGQILLAG